MSRKDAIKGSSGKSGMGENNPGEKDLGEKGAGEKSPGGEKNPGMRPGVVRRALLVALGCVGLALGALGAVLPLLPAFPFLMLAAFCFAKSSERLNAWFTGTRLYRDNLESFVAGQGMTRRTKVRIMVTVTALMSVGFVMMHAVPVGRVVLACVWVFHILYFSLGVRTKPAPSEA